MSAVDKLKLQYLVFEQVDDGEIVGDDGQRIEPRDNGQYYDVATGAWVPCVILLHYITPPPGYQVHLSPDDLYRPGIDGPPWDKDNDDEATT